MERKLRLKVLIGVVVVAAVVIGVLVWPEPKEARADFPVLFVTLNVEWLDDIEPYDIEAEVILLDIDGDPVGQAWKHALNANTTLDQWTYTFANVPDEAQKFRFAWLDGDPEEYVWSDDEPGVVFNINWPNTQALGFTQCNVP